MRQLLLAGVAVGLGVGLAAGGAAADDHELVIGAAIAQSGFMTPFDGVPLRGLQIAVDEVNAAGGIDGKPVKIVYADTKSDPAQGANAAIQVLEQGADMLVVSCDFDMGAPAALIGQSQGVVTFSLCAADPKFGSQGIGDFAYSMGMSTVGEGVLAAEWAHEQGWRKAYILKDTVVEYTKSLADHFKTRWEALDGTGIVGEDTVNGLADDSVVSQISRMKNAEAPDVIFYSGGGAAGGNKVLRQIRAAGIDAPVLAGAAFDGIHWMDAVPDLSNFYNLSYASTSGDDPNPAVQELLAKHKEKFGEPPVSGQYVLGYALMEVWKKAIEQAGSADGAAVRDALDSFDGVVTIMGPTSFSPDVHMLHDWPLVIRKVTNGKPEALERQAPSEIPEITY